jgi:ketosteroid isomerase-like protein
MSELDDFKAKTLTRMMESETALHDGDAEPRISMWSHHDPVTLFGAVVSKSGWAELGPFFHWLAAQFSNTTGYTFDLVACDVSGDLAYTVGYERYTGSLSGGPAQDVVLRVTHIFRREEGEWKVVHRHGDSASLDETLLSTEGRP